MAQFIAHANLLATAWKNGAGSTTEIAVFPRGAGFDDFDWRISLASIARSGAFSVFPGIDRSLCLVSGEGVTLTLDGARRVALNAASPLIRFPGEAAVHADVAALTTDFNVMTRRSRCSHQFERLAAPAELARRGQTTLLFVADGAGVVARGGGQQFKLGRFDALLLDAGDATHWSLDADGGASVFVTDLIT
ncbi:HutD family protein [Janthinobacterium fluminis]|uniref:HutD family protein n=1 Tax=Janthinobacterium fluminis TaxID=2987524 RepID=A0ABT5K1L5_9BURK|nr:HutD family protein [Janthinobacterium fluminis]MDC8758565.1 HutD family protein [Janthinobacterium fluminis]